MVAFESRRATELGDLIRRHGGLPIVAPALRELPMEENSAAHAFLGRLERGEVDVVVLLTGVGVRALAAAVAKTCPPERLADLLASTILVARGPKPVAELRKLGLAPHVRVPEPNTWRELLAVADAEVPVRGRLVGVVEYGARGVALLAGLAARGADVVRVPVYRWALPEDRGPLREAVSCLARGEADYVLFTSGRQVDHVMQTAEGLGLCEAVLDAASRTVVGSIGPVCSEALRRHKLPVDLEPEHPKMGHLVVTIARRGAAVLKLHP
ncbi:MAG: uroporphyrinogen-III synthase [Acidimicrobiia bacterium]